ncbi:MAG: hypothetical protein JWM59_1946 [Verrucomicrobiales bacterium]|nr:hypothetical protein [Verrucomicrobiales bacterium]
MSRTEHFLLTALFLILSGVSSRAHEVRPAFLELREGAPNEFEVLWKVPAPGGIPLAGEEIPHEQRVLPPGDPGASRTMPCGCPAPTAEQLARGTLAIHPALPADAMVISLVRSERIQGAELKRWTIRTGPRGLEGWDVMVHGLPATMVDVLVRIALRDGQVITHLLRPDAPSFRFQAGDGAPPVRAYFTLGVEHILLGVDHLLFVLALMLIVRGTRRLVKTITAFTLAHSITLALATLGMVHIPAAPVEAVIALSIVFVAAEIIRSRRGQPGLTERAPWVVAFTFGLLHGFGFAGALAEVGLPPGDIPTALLLFNAGVEAGQLAFVAMVLFLTAPMRWNRLPFPRWTYSLPPYAIGSVAMFWAIQRLTIL